MGIGGYRVLTSGGVLVHWMPVIAMLTTSYNLPSPAGLTLHLATQAADVSTGLVSADSNTYSDTHSSTSSNGSVSGSNSALYGRYEHLMDLILQHIAQPSSEGASAGEVSGDGGTVPPAVDQVLRSSCREDDHWVLIQCGLWATHPAGRQGPALAVIQAWQGPQGADYITWELGPDGLPTGYTYNSGSGEGCVVPSSLTARRFLSMLSTCHKVLATSIGIK